MSAVKKPGDLVLGTGRFLEEGKAIPERAGSIVLKAGDVEMLRFNGDGVVYIRGERVDANADVYKAFKAWLATAYVVTSPSTTSKASGLVVRTQKARVN